MAYFKLTSPLNPFKVVVVGITFTQLVDATAHDGEHIWLLELRTEALDKNDNEIKPYFINLVSLENADEEIEKAIEEISKQIDWEPSYSDTRAPIVDSIEPTTPASINSTLIFKLKDVQPAAGIDINSIEVYVNGFDVTSEVDIRGDIYEYECIWRPWIRVYDTYE